MPINKYIILIFFSFLISGVILEVFEEKKWIKDFLLLKSLYESKKNNKIIKVKISGCVKQPGCYQLIYGKRLHHLIEKAKGLLPYANNRLSLYALLKDGEEYVIPYRKLRNDEKININTSSVDILYMLPKINKNIAKNILIYRQKYGKFKNAKELKNVSGIGEKKFELLKKFVIIGQ